MSFLLELITLKCEISFIVQLIIYAIGAGWMFIFSAQLALVI